MNLAEATRRACQEQSLPEALSWICVWESERAIAQALANAETGKKWDTCFLACIRSVVKEWNTAHGAVPPGRIALATDVKNLLTVNSCWLVKLPDGNAVSKMWVKELTASTVKLAGEFGLKTRYWLPDITFIEPVSIEPAELNAIYHEITWRKP